MCRCGKGGGKALEHLSLRWSHLPANPPHVLVSPPNAALPLQPPPFRPLLPSIAIYLLFNSFAITSGADQSADGLRDGCYLFSVCTVCLLGGGCLQMDAAPKRDGRLQVIPTLPDARFGSQQSAGDPSLGGVGHSSHPHQKE